MRWVVMVFRTKRSRKPQSFIFSTKKDAKGFQQSVLKAGAALASEPFKYVAKDWKPRAVIGALGGKKK